ncbi:MAG: urease accessory protein UreE [Chthoniobacterales bacterium]
MLRIEKRLDPLTALSASERDRLPRLVLPFERRQKSRQLAQLENGEEAQLFLPRGTVLRNGDLLEAQNGVRIRVIAAFENVLNVTADTPSALIRAAYHLGNRHMPVQLGNGFLRLENDPVLKEMLVRLGVHVEEKHEPFEPEAGAYGGGHRHDHDAIFEQDYALAQQVFQEHHGHHDDKNMPH